MVELQSEEQQQGFGAGCGDGTVEGDFGRIGTAQGQVGGTCVGGVVGVAFEIDGGATGDEPEVGGTRRCRNHVGGGEWRNGDFELATAAVDFGGVGSEEGGGEFAVYVEVEALEEDEVGAVDFAEPPFADGVGFDDLHEHLCEAADHFAVGHVEEHFAEGGTDEFAAGACPAEFGAVFTGALKGGVCADAGFGDAAFFADEVAFFATVEGNVAEGTFDGDDAFLFGHGSVSLCCSVCAANGEKKCVWSVTPMELMIIRCCVVGSCCGAVDNTRLMQGKIICKGAGQKWPKWQDWIVVGRWGGWHVGWFGGV